MKVDFSYQTQYGTFSDSLYFDDSLPSPTQDEINALQQQRLDSWISLITSSQNESASGA